MRMRASAARGARIGRRTRERRPIIIMLASVSPWLDRPENYILHPSERLGSRMSRCRVIDWPHRFSSRFPGDKPQPHGRTLVMIASALRFGGTFKLIYLARQNGAQHRLRAALLLPASSCGAFELANQFNRAVGRSKKIIGAGWLFKIRRPRIVSGSQPYRDPARAFARSRAYPLSLCYKTAMIYKEMFDEICG